MAGSLRYMLTANRCIRIRLDEESESHPQPTVEEDEDGDGEDREPSHGAARPRRRVASRVIPDTSPVASRSPSPAALSADAGSTPSTPSGTLTPNSQVSAPATNALVERRDAYTKAYRTDIIDLIDRFLDDELKNGTIRGVSRPGLEASVFSIIGTMRMPVLEALLAGNLPRREICGRKGMAPYDELTEVLDQNLEASSRDDLEDCLPAVYGNYFTTADGYSPTPNQMRGIMRGVQRYIRGRSSKDKQFAMAVDDFRNPKVAHVHKSRRSYRKYLCKRGELRRTVPAKHLLTLQCTLQAKTRSAFALSKWWRTFARS